jgi:hypothetical protein
MATKNSSTEILIKLSDKASTVISAEDFCAVFGYRWRLVSPSKNYAAATELDSFGQYGVVLMHRVIMAAPKGLVVDHINGDTLDNRRSNLRLCTHAQNIRNRRVSKHSQSGLKGVEYDRKRKVWCARIAAFGNRIYLGSFDNPLDAASAYDAAAIKFHGEFAKTNKMLGLI